MRALAFAVVFLAFTACHREVKKLETAKVLENEVTKVESVTTAPTERTTERWYFRITPGIGRALPTGQQETARTPPPAGSSPAGFLPSPGLGYDVDEYERITEKLEPVAKTTATTDKRTDITTVEASERDTDVGPGLKFYLTIAIVLVLILVGAYLYIKYAPPNLLASLVKKVLP